MKKNIKFYIKLLYIIVIVVFSLMFSIFGHDYPIFRISHATSSNGVLDIKNWNLQKYNTITFNGEWDFYWNEFVYYNDLNKTETTAVVKIPSVWNRYKVNDEYIPGNGYATYHLKVTNVIPNTTLAIRMPPLSTAYRLYIDDRLLIESGVVGKTKEVSQPQYKVQVEEFTPKSDSFDIIVQISNFSYARGGFWYSPQLGTVDGISRFDNHVLYRDIFLLGCFFIMMLHSMIIIRYRKEEKNYLYFVLLCIACIARLSIYSSYLITYVPYFSEFSVIVRLDYLSFVWIALTFLLLTQSQFQGFLSPDFVKKLHCFALIYTVLIIIVPIPIFTHFTILIQSVCFVMAGVAACRIIILFLEGKQSGIILLATSIIFLGTAIHDLLLQNNFIVCGAIELSPVGFLIFLFSEELIIAQKYTSVMKENEMALEKIIEVTKKEKDTELKFLRAQIKPHFVHNALNSIIAISRRDSNKSRELLVEFSYYLRNCFDLDNLDSFIPIKKEIQLVQSYLNIEQVRFGDLFEIHYDIEDIDIDIPPLILQPLVENALVHGIRKKLSYGIIEILIKKQEDKLYIGVRDDGIGISPILVEQLLSGETDYQGVGIFNINQRLNKMYGTSLVIENINTGGTNIYMKIPLK